MPEFYAVKGITMVRFETGDPFNVPEREATDEDVTRFRVDYDRCMAPPKKAAPKKAAKKAKK